MVYDVVIVGGGAAGLTAALYAARRTLKTLVVTKDIGGQTATTSVIENYPGVEKTTGPELMLTFQKQAQQVGAEFLLEEIVDLQNTGAGFILTTEVGEKIQTQSVILAFGLTPKSLEVPGEKELRNKGVCYCATCDAPLYKGKTVAVVGQTMAAFDAALLLSRIAQKVYLVVAGEKLAGVKEVVEQVKNTKNVEVIYRAQVSEVLGEKNVTGIAVIPHLASPLAQEGGKLDPSSPPLEKGRNRFLPSATRGGDKEGGQEIKVDGVFVQLGHTAKTSWLDGIVELNKHGEVATNRDCGTSLLGVFCAGDVSDIVYKQVIISAGEGAKAALQAYKYILEKQGKKALSIDWS